MNDTIQAPVYQGLKRVGTSALNLANRICYRLDRYAGADADEQISPLFVVGLPRSGTTLAYEIIVQAFEVNYLSHLFEFMYGLPNLTTRITRNFTASPLPQYKSTYGHIPGFFSPAENFKFWMRWFPENPVLGHYVPSQLLDNRTARDANRVVGSMTRISGRPYVFKNVYFSLSISSLLKVFPTARILIVHRDLESAAASLYKRRCELQGSRNWWSIRPPFSNTVQGRDLLEQVAFQCVRSEQIMQQAVSADSAKRCMIIPYSDICTSPPTVIEELAGWLGTAFRKRSNCRLPESFRHSPSIGFPNDTTERFRSITASMRNDKGEYLERVTREVLQQSSEKHPHRPGRARAG